MRDGDCITEDGNARTRDIRRKIVVQTSRQNLLGLARNRTFILEKVSASGKVAFLVVTKTVDDGGIYRYGIAGDPAAECIVSLAAPETVTQALNWLRRRSGR